MVSKSIYINTAFLTTSYGPLVEPDQNVNAKTVSLSFDDKAAQHLHDHGYDNFSQFVSAAIKWELNVGKN